MLTRNEALQLVREYKKVISPRFDGNVKVMMYGSYSKGNPNKWSMDVDKVSLLIEPVLMSDKHWSPLYDDVMKTGIMV